MSALLRRSTSAFMAVGLALLLSMATEVAETTESLIVCARSVLAPLERELHLWELRSAVSAICDRWGIAHIEAENTHDLFIAEGFAGYARAVAYDWDFGLATSTPGQSGQPGSPHYADLLPMWANGKYFPLACSSRKVAEVAAHTLRLKPAKA